MSEAPIRDAATVVLLRRMESGPAVLMGQRGARAVFMPSKYVFPGGAVEPADAETVFARPLSAETHAALRDWSKTTPEALAAAAIRELVEETGQVLGQPGTGCDWPGFDGHAPDAAPLRYVFRAITPPGRPRRFDARFFLVDAAALATDLDDHSRAEDELAHLQWVLLSQARALDVPFVTEIVLAEVAAIAAGRTRAGVPFFDNSGETSLFRRITPAAG